MIIDIDTSEEEEMGLGCRIIQTMIEVVNQTPEIMSFGSYNYNPTNSNYGQEKENDRK